MGLGLEKELEEGASSSNDEEDNNVVSIGFWFCFFFLSWTSFLFPFGCFYP